MIDSSRSRHRMNVETTKEWLLWPLNLWRPVESNSLNTAKLGSGDIEFCRQRTELPRLTMT